jgi:hypothetical protein
MDLVDRLHARLTDALRSEPDLSGLTIGDVYQRLIPYRSVRSELGILELAEYEHALLKLLAGERGYLTLEGDHALAELQAELESANPILGLYRDYSAVVVRLRGEESPAGGPSPAAPAPAPLNASAASNPSAPSQAATTSPPAPAHRASLRCGYCDIQLPADPDLRFCPACGRDQVHVRCERCGGRLRDEWKFCIRCGTPRSGAADRA